MTPTVVEQRTTALQRANDARMQQRTLREELARLPRQQGALLAARMLLEEPEQIASVRCFVFLESVPGMGESKAKVILMHHRIYAAKRVRELTPRQRSVLAGALVALADPRGR